MILRQKANVTIFLISLGLSILNSGCLVGGSNSPPALPTAPAAPTLIQCNNSLVDTGQKSSATTVARGYRADTKMIPGTSSPATAYTDQTGMTIKLTYLNGTQWSTEIVSGEGSATFVRLAFLSSGVPMVFWTLGTNLKAAIRSTALPNPGSWTAKVIDTGVAPRAVEVSVNPLDQVGLIFLTDTAVTGRAKFLYCDSPCTSPSGFQAMASSPYLENTNLVAAEVATGVAWCKVNSTTYYPAAVYGVTGGTHYTVCQQSSLSNCLNGANWTTSAVNATSTVSSNLYIDSSITGDVPKVISLGASGIVPARMGTTACTSAPTAFANTGASIGGATDGNQWMSLMKDPTGHFHIVDNQSTTSVRYYNSTGTDIVGGFNGAGMIETTPLAAGANGGATLDPAGGQIWTAFGLNAAPYDLRLDLINSYSVSSNTASFTSFSPDLTGDLQLTAANSQQKNISIAATSTGNPAIAYVDFSVGATAGAKLKYAYRPGPTSAAVWDEPSLIPDTINPEFPSLAFDQNDTPWISYFEAATNRFYLLHGSTADGGGTWATYAFPAIPAGAPIALPAANNTSLAMYYSGRIANPVMIIIDTNAASKGVKAAMLNQNTRSWSSPVTIDGLTTGALGATHLSSDFDLNGNIIVGYQNLNKASATISISSNATTWSSPLTISAINRGPGLAVKLNPSGGVAASYFDVPNNSVYYASCSGTLATCSSGGWTTQQVEGAAGVSALAAASSSILRTSLSFTSAGAPYVFYPRGAGADGNLIISTNATGNWVGTVAAAGTNAALAGAPALNFGIAGWAVSSYANAPSGLVTAFTGPGNWLYSASCGE